MNLWDARNQLSGISGLVSASFIYGPFGRRLSKTIGGNTTDYLYDGVNPIQELAGGTVDANMLDGLGVDEYFQRADLLGTWDYLDDALGSTLALADPTGTVQTQYTYSPFGNTTTQGSSSSNSYQFTGRENDGDGLYYYRARYYDPMVARFISQDPTGFAAGDTNLYGYVGESPFGFVDPLGLDRKPPKKNPLTHPSNRPRGWLQRVEHALNPGSPTPPTPKGCRDVRVAANAVNAPAFGSLIENGLIWLGLGEATGEEAGAAAATGTSKAEGSATEIGKALSPGYAVGAAIVAGSGCGP